MNAERMYAYSELDSLAARQEAARRAPLPIKKQDPAKVFHELPDGRGITYLLEANVQAGFFEEVQLIKNTDDDSWNIRTARHDIVRKKPGEVSSDAYVAQFLDADGNDADITPVFQTADRSRQNFERNPVTFVSTGEAQKRDIKALGKALSQHLPDSPHMEAFKAVLAQEEAQRIAAVRNQFTLIEGGRPLYKQEHVIYQAPKEHASRR